MLFLADILPKAKEQVSIVLSASEVSSDCEEFRCLFFFFFFFIFFFFPQLVVINPGGECYGGKGFF